MVCVGGVKFPATGLRVDHGSAHRTTEVSIKEPNLLPSLLGLGESLLDTAQFTKGCIVLFCVPAVSFRGIPNVFRLRLYYNDEQAFPDPRWTDLFKQIVWEENETKRVFIRDDGFRMAPLVRYAFVGEHGAETSGNMLNEKIRKTVGYLQENDRCRNIASVGRVPDEQDYYCVYEFGFKQVFRTAPSNAANPSAQVMAIKFFSVGNMYPVSAPSVGTISTQTEKVHEGARPGEGSSKRALSPSGDASKRPCHVSPKSVPKKTKVIPYGPSKEIKFYLQDKPFVSIGSKHYHLLHVLLWNKTDNRTVGLADPECVTLHSTMALLQDIRHKPLESMLYFPVDPVQNPTIMGRTGVDQLRFVYTPTPMTDAEVVAAIRSVRA
jgi:hypothetical protein